jgi:hypothetical protein
VLLLEAGRISRRTDIRRVLTNANIVAGSPALRRPHGALRQALDFLAVAPRPQDQIEIAEDDGQEIVEIVRDPSGQLKRACPRICALQS